MNDTTGQTTWTYSSGGEVIQRAQQTFGNTTTMSWSYDAAGRLTGMSYPNGFALSYGYDVYGRLSGIYSNLASWSTIADAFLYQPATDVRYGWRFGNSNLRLTTLNHDGRISNLFGSGAQNISLGYSTVENIASRSDFLFASQSANYTYDPVDRLDGVGSSSDPQAFLLDKVGNRTAHTRYGSGHSITIAPSSNRLTYWAKPGLSRSFGFDAAGNVTSESRSDGTRGYRYDAFDRLEVVAVNGVDHGYYRSNAFNQRVYRNAFGQERYYGYGASGELLYETGTTPSAYVWLDGQLLGVARGGQFYAAFNDQVGRPEALVDVNGTIAWRSVNNAFDRSVVTDSIGGLQLGFPGQIYDYESGLWYNWHRYYDAEVGRYFQSDPIGLVGGINTYSYAAGNPLTYVDPDGRVLQLAGGAVVGGMFGAVGNGVSSWTQGKGFFNGQALKNGFVGGAIGGAIAATGALAIGGAVGAGITDALNQGASLACPSSWGKVDPRQAAIAALVGGAFGPLQIPGTGAIGPGVNQAASIGVGTAVGNFIDFFKGLTGP